MAYVPATSQPCLIAGKLGSGQRLWMYSEASAAASVVDIAGYFTDAYTLGMRAGDLVFHYNIATQIWSGHTVITCTAAAGADLGNGTTIGLDTNSD